MTEVPVKQRSVCCALCKKGRFLAIPQRWGNNANKIRKTTKGRNRNRKRALNFVYRDDKLVPVCKECGIGEKLVSFQHGWDEYVVQSMMGI